MHRILTVAVCAAMVVLSSFAYAATYYVAANGSDATGDGSAANPWASINYADANSLLAPGDTVFVGAGTYNQCVKLTAKSAGVLYQADAAGVTIQSTGAWSAWEVGGSVGGGYYGMGSNFGNSGPTIDGFTIVGGNAGWYGALSLYNAYRTEVRNCVIDGAGVAVPYMCAFASYTGAGNFIHNNVVKYGGASVGVYLADSRNDGNQIINNTIFGNPGGWAVWVTGYQAGYQPGLGQYAGLYDRVFNNILDGGYYVLDTPVGFTVEADYNLVRGGVGYHGGASQGAHDVVGLDPMLGPDYHLLPGSPAINAGLDLGLPYYGSAPDLGAFEVVPEPAAMAGLAMGLVGVAGLRRRRQG